MTVFGPSEVGSARSARSESFLDSRFGSPTKAMAHGLSRGATGPERSTQPKKKGYSVSAGTDSGGPCR